MVSFFFFFAFQYALSRNQTSNYVPFFFYSNEFMLNYYQENSKYNQASNGSYCLAGVV